MPVPKEAGQVRVAFLPPMSGLAATEPVWEPGRINVLIGEGQTAQVLRNLCHQIYSNNERNGEWNELVAHIRALFGAELEPPRYVTERGEITMRYREHGVKLDLSSSGRGLQQTLLLLAHLYSNPGTVLLLDEPDAHLEILRQRQTYNLMTEVARRQGSQIIAASHSEVVLNEAADRDMVVAFVGAPHRIDDRGAQVVKALKEIGFDHYYLAEQRGWILYLEGSTDLAILQAFAESLRHPAGECLQDPFVHYIGNQPMLAAHHFHGLREAKPDLVAVAVLDRLERELPTEVAPWGLTWSRREIECYLCSEETLLRYAAGRESKDLFSQAESERRLEIMRETIREVADASRTLGRDPWSPDTKVTDDFLDPLFRKYFQRLNMPNVLRKTDYHELARLVPADDIDAEVSRTLDVIVDTAKRARPRQSDA
jgi:hypothetical protein